MNFYHPGLVRKKLIQMHLFCILCGGGADATATAATTATATAAGVVFVFVVISQCLIHKGR